MQRRIFVTRLTAIFTALAFSIALLGPPPARAASKLQVMTATTDLASLAQEVGGDKVDVESIARGYQDPHFVDAKPSFLLKLKRADLLIVVGLELEIGWLPPLINQSTNPKIQVGAPGYLDASRFAKILEIPTGQVTRAEGDVRVLPLLGRIAAGAPILAEEHVEEHVAVPGMLTSSGDCFLLRVKGESMMDAGILDGDYVVVRRQDDCEEGEIVAALVDDSEATVKRLHRVAGRVRLSPENSTMEPFYPDAVQVLGKVVGVFRRL